MIKVADKLQDFQSPLIMGIINVTPDSFYEGSRQNDLEVIIDNVRSMIASGVDIIDVGGVSTRPNADLLTCEEELDRVIPVLKHLRHEFPELLISVDTFRSEVAQKSVEHGANIINDVYGGRFDQKMFETVADLDVPYILMHSRGDAENMQDLCDYDNVAEDVCLELSKDIEKLRELGVKDIIVDPGFGFAKTVEQNYELFREMNLLKVLNCPILIGISRKSMIYKLLNSDASNALNGTSVLNTFGLLNSASIIRVHDVKEAVEVRKIVALL
ncbi:dihydropteroate synthase [Brumimicrobium aurantiacum]|uniref:dihydropteroate synthase n=2 Tax=Brumimicrobium aurantiacum TaxID=1737063 RepID=A0A3E1EVB8_9FLAO|nr:dihydropteroate synthase [Brumimicrobium aurantiacum]